MKYDYNFYSGNKYNDSMIIAYCILIWMYANAISIDSEMGTELLPSHDKFVKELQELKDAVTPRLANYLYDYLIEAIAGECFHCKYECEKTLKPDAYNGTMSHSRYFDPRSFLEVMEKLFCDYEWHDCFGGKKWGTAIRYAKKYGKIPDPVFIDFVIDLQHNTGSILNKSLDNIGSMTAFQDFMYDMRNFLNKKTYGDEMSLLDFRVYVPREVKKLMERYVALYIDPSLHDEIYERWGIAESRWKSYDFCLIGTRETWLAKEEIDASWECIKKYKGIKYEYVIKFHDDDIVDNLSFGYEGEDDDDDYYC